MEICRRYSNRPDPLGSLINLLQKIKNGTPDDHEQDLVSVSGNTANVWRVSDRLSETDVRTLLDAYRTGTTTRTLAARYNVGTSTIKRLLKEHQVRRRTS